MGACTAVRWFVIFINGDAEVPEHSDSSKFPATDFWQQDKEAARKEAKRVLRQIRESGDTGSWKAVGHPDPFEVAKGRHPIEQWIISTEDVLSEHKAE